MAEDNRLLALMPRMAAAGQNAQFTRDRQRMQEMAGDLSAPPGRFNWGQGTPPQMTPQEDDLYRRHLSNLWGPGGVDNPNGSRSTLYQAVVGNGDKSYSIPTVWDGRILPPRQAVERVEREGWDKFPSYASPEEADARYAKLHDWMERDTADYFRSR